MAKICSECGEQVDPNAEFCPACLATIETAAPPVTPQPQPAPVAPPPPAFQAPARSNAPLIIGAFVGGLLLAGAAWRLTATKEPEAPPVASAPATPTQVPAAPTAAPAQPAPQPEVIAQVSSDSFDWQPANLDPNGDNWLAFRSQPDLKGVRIDKLEQSARFRVLEKRERWWKVELTDGRQGWVSAKYVGPAS
jgi:hypothetical protein